MKKDFRNVLVVCAGAMFTACSSTDLFDADALENDTKLSYAENFVKKYPNVSLNQSWDFSNPQPVYSLSSAGKTVKTRAAGGTITQGDWYEVENNTLTWMHEKLKEHEDHRDLGEPFIMMVPDYDFTIVPIYQGIAGAVWELHMVVGGVDHLVWTKSQDIQIQDLCGDKNPGWHDVYNHPTYEWNQDEGNHWEALDNTDGSDKVNTEGVENKVTATRAKVYKCSGFPAGEEMYFYLKITTSGNDDNNLYHYVGDQLSSVDHQMLALSVDRPANIPEDYEAMIIGCEDAYLENSDWDYNDVVFLIYGKKVPEPETIKKIDEVTTKRYMIEDLGDTDDFDFNDIVVDVSEIVTKNAIYQGDVFLRYEYDESTRRQTATIRHLGGTLPFTLKIGDTQLEERQGVLGQDPNETFDITGWDMEKNNIGVSVQQLNNNGVFTISFPKEGEAPMIIAVDPTQGWMPERQSVPESWFYVPESAE